MVFVHKYKFWLLGAVCVVLLGVLYIYERSKPPVVIGAANRTVIYDADAVTEPPKAQEAVAAPSDAVIKVYITGAVAQPGVYEVPGDARVDDVLALAGGATEDADLLRINLAAHVSDAEQIIVPKQGEPLPETITPSGNASSAAAADAGGLININTADAAALMTLPGIGTVLAENIVAYRDTNGMFKTIDDIKNVSRIGDVTFDKIKDRITVQ